MSQRTSIIAKVTALWSSLKWMRSSLKVLVISRNGSLINPSDRCIPSLLMTILPMPEPVLDGPKLVPLQRLWITELCSLDDYQVTQVVSRLLPYPSVSSYLLSGVNSISQVKGMFAFDENDARFQKSEHLGGLILSRLEQLANLKFVLGFHLPIKDGNNQVML